jgi:hypothetical protein
MPGFPVNWAEIGQQEEIHALFGASGVTRGKILDAGASRYG